MSWLERFLSQGSSPASSSTPQSVTIDGAAFPLAGTPEAFYALIANGGRAVLRFPTPQYGVLLRQLVRALEERYGSNALQARELFHSLVFCAGCMWQFPPSYLMSLQGMAVGRMIGATPGVDRFAKTGACTQCGATESLLVYDAVPSDSVTIADVEAIRDYWRDLALNWWNSHQNRSSGICDYCDAQLARGDGYLCATDLICDACVQRGLMSEGLAQLQRDPNYYGNGLLRQVRALRR